MTGICARISAVMSAHVEPVPNLNGSESRMDDRAIHLLFSANRWELA